MAFTCSMALNHTRIHGQDIHSHSSFHPLRQFLAKDKKARQKPNFTLCATTDKNAGDKTTESVDNGDASENRDSQLSQLTDSPSPFVGAKISSQIAARSRTADSTSQKQKEVSNAVPKRPASQQKPILTSPSTQQRPAPTSPFTQQKPISTSPFSGADSLKASKPSGLDTLKSSRPSVFLDTKQDFMKPGPKNLLNALRESDPDGGRTSNFSQPVVPTNLFDEPKRLPNDEKKFDFSLNTVQIVLIFSFLTIISVMLGTAFLVWKLGAIHYNEY